ncbi:MAG: hypothetical protein ABSC22_20435 [Roseiarcus sp.]|jgi:hypothetical protein
MANIIETLRREAAVIRGAPWSVSVIALAVAGCVWFLVKEIDAGTISAKNATIETQRTQIDAYRDKLNGATPDEAKAHLDDLTARIVKLEPRTLSRDRTLLLQLLNQPSGNQYVVDIDVDQFCTDCGQYAQEFWTLLSDAHWKISTTTGIRDSQSISSTGLAVLTPSLTNPLPEATALTRALKAANIPFELKAGGAPQVDDAIAKVAGVVITRANH